MAMCLGSVTKGTKANATVDRCWRAAGASGYCWQHDPERVGAKAKRRELAQRMQQLVETLAYDTNANDGDAAVFLRLEAQSIMRALEALDGGPVAPERAGGRP